MTQKEYFFEDDQQLFIEHALIDANSVEYSYLYVIGRKLVDDKCKGLPLVIKSLGNLLRDKRNKKEQANILNSDLWELYEKNSIGSIGILPVLWLISHFFFTFTALITFLHMLSYFSSSAVPV